MIYSDINLLKEPFRTLVKLLMQKLADAGLSFGIYETLRDAARQKSLYQSGKSRIKHSLHQDGLACDIVYKDKNGSWSWDDTEAYDKLGAMVHTISGLAWGGDWHFKDMCHVEYHKEVPVNPTLTT